MKLFKYAFLVGSRWFENVSMKMYLHNTFVCQGPILTGLIYIYISKINVSSYPDWNTWL